VAGAIAATRVRNVWETAGAAVEEIKSSDYGEDFLIQTSWKGVMDHSRIWVQVKGHDEIRINSRTGNPAPQRKISVGHALRWFGSADLVVVIQWDLKRDIGWYALPVYQIDPVELTLSGQQTTSIHFDGGCIFNVESANSLAWLARQEHALRAIGRATSVAATDEPALLMILTSLICKLEIGSSPDGDWMGEEFHGFLREAYKMFRNGRAFSEMVELTSGLRGSLLEMPDFAPGIPDSEKAFHDAALFYLIYKADEAGTSLYGDLAPYLINAVRRLALKGYSSIEEWVAG
jgi:hypothetical protein